VQGLLVVATTFLAANYILGGVALAALVCPEPALADAPA
jgi:hypothetical protein